MTTDLVVRRAEIVRLDTDQIQYLAHTEFVSDRIRGNLPAIFATIATGREVGIGDMASLRHIHIIDGKPTYSAEIMVVLARQRGHSIQGEVTEGRAVVTGRRADNGDTMTSEWTVAMAERAGLLNKSNWKKYPEAMLWARAVSQLCRELFADCFAGATYTPEEIEGSSGEPSGTAVPPPPPVSGESGQVASPDVQDEAAGTPFQYDVDAPVEPAGSQAGAVFINEKQRTRLFTIASKAGVPEEDVRAIVLEFTGQESTKLIEVGRMYDGIVAAVQAKGAA